MSSMQTEEHTSIQTKLRRVLQSIRQGEGVPLHIRISARLLKIDLTSVRKMISFIAARINSLMAVVLTENYCSPNRSQIRNEVLIIAFNITT